MGNQWMRWLMALSIAGLIFLLLTWLDASAPDLTEKLGLGEFKQTAKGYLSIIIAGIIKSLLPPPEPPVRERPVDPPPPQPSGNECAAQLTAAEQELADWHAYKREMDAYLADRESRRAFMETRHATLRLMLIAILVLAFGVCVAGWIASEHYDYVSASVAGKKIAPVNGAVFIKNLGVVSVSYAVVGAMIGAALYWVRATTTLTHAWRCGLIAPLLLNTAVLLVALPNMVGAIWEQKVAVFGISMIPLIGWFIAFRLLFTPLLCMAGSLLVFSALNWLRPNQAAAL